MESSYFITGIRTDRLIRLVLRNGISFQPKYIARFLFLLSCSLQTSVFSFFERLRFGNKISSMKCPDNPIFIIGHWRSGTTFLHQLLNQCPELTTPSFFQVGIPDCFLVSRNFFVPQIQFFMSNKRTVDNVSVGLDEPQEDEYALFRMTTFSPVEKLLFPREPSFFLSNCKSFLPDKMNEPFWRSALISFCKKIVYQTGKRIVFKNPFHSMRIPYLREVFPKAKFIHIYRNPLDVIPSSMHMWKIVGEQNSLRKESKPPSMEHLVEMYDTMLWKIRKDFIKLPENDRCEVRFEELELKAIDTLRTICHEIGVTFSDEYKNNMQALLNKIGRYRKNCYTLSKYQKEYKK